MISKSAVIDESASKLYVNLSTLNFVLAFAGYQLVTALCSPLMNAMKGSQFITVPYRFVVFCLALFLIFGVKKPITFQKPVINCLWAYWILLTVRLVIDFYLQYSFEISEPGKEKVLTFMYLITLPPVIAFAKTWNMVDYHKAFKWSIIAFVIIAVSSVLFNKALLYNSLIVNSSGRVDGGLALNTITFGHCGVSLALLSFYIYRYRTDFNKWLSILLFLLGIFVLLRAGSRGPLFSLVIAISLIVAFKSKQFIYVILILTAMALCLYIFRDFLMELIDDISPTLNRRLVNTIEKGDLSGREQAYSDALHIWFNNLILGKYFAYYIGTPAYPMYSHNIILDAAIAGGIIGVVLILTLYFTVLKALYYSLSYNINYAWIIILTFQSYLGCLSSGSFYQTIQLSMGIVAISMLGLNTRNNVEESFNLKCNEEK